MSRVLVIRGENKTGKTTIALTAPRNIGWHEFDIGGLERAVWRFPGWEDYVDLKQYRIPIESLKDKIGLQGRRKQIVKVTGMSEIWESFTDNYIAHLEDPNINTIVIDPYPQMWKANSQSLLQEKQQEQIEKAESQGKNESQINLRERLLPIEYAGPNDRMRYLIYGSRETLTHLILLTYMDDEREDALVDGNIQSILTGKRIPAGWKWDHIKKELDVAIETRVEEVERQQNGNIVKMKLPYAKVIVSGEGLDLEGMDFVEPTWQMIDNAIRIVKGEEIIIDNGNG